MMSPTRTSEPGLELVAGVLCLDFANTLRGRTTPSPYDHLAEYRDLVRWSQKAEQVSDTDAAQLLAIAGERPDEAAGTLQRAVELREAFFRTVVSLTTSGARSAADLDCINREVARAGAQLRVRYGPRRVELGWSNVFHLDRPLWPIVRSAVELLVAGDLTRVRVCGAKTCSWLFLDQTKNHSRKWCDMAVCGNREKARRNRRRRG
jgi:predicted RNA-binding Zn ribbon-like protein